MEADYVLDVPHSLLKQMKSQPVLLLANSYQWVCDEMGNVVSFLKFENPFFLKT